MPEVCQAWIALCEYMLLPDLWSIQMLQEANDAEGCLSLATILMFIEWNKEALLRCKVLSPAPQIAHHVRQIFHSSTFYHANVGCLLEQVARYGWHY